MNHAYSLLFRSISALNCALFNNLSLTYLCLKLHHIQNNIKHQLTDEEDSKKQYTNL